MVAQVVGELFERERKRMGLDERHALDVILRLSLELGERLQHVAPPERFLGRLRFRNVHRKRMFQAREVELVDEQREIEERGRGQLAAEKAGLIEVQSADACESHRLGSADTDGSAALLILERELAVQRRDDV